MPEEQKFTFKAVIEQNAGIDAAFVRFPHDVEKTFGTKGQVKIQALFDGRVPYRGSLANMGQGCHVLGLTKAVRSQLGKSFGDTVEVTLERDIAPRIVEVPEDAASLLKQNPRAAEFYEKLSYTDRKEYIRWIETAKRAETRQARLKAFIEKLLVGKKLVDK